MYAQAVLFAYRLGRMSTSGQTETDTAQKMKFSIKDFFMRIW